MSLTESSKIKEILNNPEAVKIVQKYIPAFNPADKQMKLALNMTLKAVVAFPQSKVSKEDAPKLFAELTAANLE